MLRNRFILAVLAATVVVAPVSAQWDDVTKTYSGDYSNVVEGAGYARGVVGGVAATSNANERWNDTNLVKNNVTITVTGSSTNQTKITELCGIGVGGYSAVGNKSITVTTTGDDSDVYVGLIVGGTHYNFSGFEQNPAAYRPAVTGYPATGTKVEYTTDLYAALQSTSDKSIKITVEGGTVGQIRGGNNNAGTIVANGVQAAKDAGLTGDALSAYLTGNPAWALQEKIEIKVTGGKVGYAANGTDKYGNASEEAIIGVGGSGYSVNNEVCITIGGDADVLGNVYAGGKNKYDSVSFADSTKIEITDDATVCGDVYAGGAYGNNSSSLVKEGTTVILSGGQILADNTNGYSGNVYAGGDRDNIGENTEGVSTRIVITGEGTKVAGTISGGGKDSTVSGERQFSVEASHDSTGRSIDEGYNLADFTDMDVQGKVTIKSLDAEGSDLTVGSTGTIKTTAGVLSGLDEVQVDGTLDITVTEDTADKAAVESRKLTFGSTAQLNVTNATGDSDAEIKLFDVDESIAGAETLTLSMDGQEVSSDMWDYSSGGIVIKALSASTLALSGNQSSFYSALKAMKAAGAADAMLSDLASSRDSATVKAQLDALSGHELATAMSSQVDGNLGHLRRLRGAMGKGTPLGTTTSVTLCSANNKGEGVGYVAPVTMGQRWRAGVQAYHEESELDADSHGDGYDRSETGAMLTAEYYVREGLTLGGALSRGRTTLKSDGARKRHEDNTSLDFYAMYGRNRWQFASAIGFGMHEHDLKRTATSAEADGYSVNFLQDVAYTVLAREKVTVQMFGTIESSWNKMDGFTEKGAYALRVDDQDAWTTDVTVGVRYNHMLPAWGNAPAGVFSAQAGVTGTLGDVDTETEMSLYGVRFSQKSARRDRWGWNIGVGVDVPVRSNVSIYATAETVVRGDSNSVDGQIGVKVAF